MKFARIFALFLALLSFGSHPANAQDTYSTYTNARFGTLVQYPSNLLIPQPEADNGDGRKFVSRDGAIELTVYGSYNVFNLTVKGALSRAQREWKSDDGRVTSWKVGKSWYVVSGYIGDDIFYEKALLVGDTIHTAIWQYPKNLRKRVDSPLTRSAHSLTAWNSSPAPKAAPTPAKKATIYRIRRRHSTTSGSKAAQRPTTSTIGGY